MIVFSIIGFIVLGFFVIGIFTNEFNTDRKNKPEGTSYLIFILIGCLVVGFVAWSVIPKSCKHNDEDFDTQVSRGAENDL